MHFQVFETRAKQCMYYMTCNLLKIVCLYLKMVQVGRRNIVNKTTLIDSEVFLLLSLKVSLFALDLAFRTKRRETFKKVSLLAVFVLDLFCFET